VHSPAGRVLSDPVPSWRKHPPSKTLILLLSIGGIILVAINLGRNDSTKPEGVSPSVSEHKEPSPPRADTVPSTYRAAFVSKLQSVMNKADSEAFSANLVHPTVTVNRDDESVLNIDCPKVEPTGGSGDGLCVGVYHSFKNDSAIRNEAKMAGFDRIVLISPHLYKILVLRGEPCETSAFCDALVDSGKIENLQ
jgi:hypothetical protein